MYIGGYREPELGSLSSFFKKVVKTASKFSPSYQTAKALKIDKFSPSQLLVNKLTAKSSPKTPPSAPVAVPATAAVAANTPDIPVALPASSQPMSFGSGGGSGGGIPLPAGDETAPVESEANYTPWLLGAAAILGGILYFKRKRG